MSRKDSNKSGSSRLFKVAHRQGNRMSAFADHSPASCYPELISPLPIHRTAATPFRQTPTTQRDPEQRQNGYFIGDPFQWLLLLAKTSHHALQKSHFYPDFCSNLSRFWAILNRFLRLFMTPSKVNITQNKWVRLVFLPEKGTPPPP
jgi:hypothetical protein